MGKSRRICQPGREVIYEPKEFDPTDFGLAEEVRTRPELIRLSEIESQCGLTNEAQDVEAYNGTLGVSVAFVNQHQPRVGQTMQGNRRSCSGTLIGPDLFLSAGHCFDPSPNPQTQVTFNFQNDPSGNPRLEQRFPILAVLEHRLGGLDYAIVRLGGNPGTIFGFAGISQVDAAVGDIVAIIGHPATVPKQVEAGPVLALSGDQIRYNDVDTLPGNSGSGILHGASGNIVGVHINGGCAGTNPETGFNLGVRVSSLLRVSPILQRLAFPTGAWRGTEAMAVSAGQLYIIQNSRLHRVDASNGSWVVLPDQGGNEAVWGDTEAMVALGDQLYIVQNSRLHRVERNGHYEKSNW